MLMQDGQVAGSATATGATFWDWVTTLPWFGIVGIVSVLVGGVIAITSMVIQHKERMAGLDDPDRMGRR